jgi:CheY-like chemotaxis protein
MSASVISFKRDEALAAGCDDFLPKPFREVELIAMLSLHLGLEWRHAGAVDAAAPELAANGPASAAELAALREIARRGEIQALRDQLAGLRNRHPDDARLQELATLAAAYQMERLRTRLAAFMEAEVSS